MATVLSGPGAIGARRVIWPDRSSGSLGSTRLDDAVDDDVRGMLAPGTDGHAQLRRAREQRRLDELSVFVQSFAPPPRMLVFGAIDFAAAVARIGKFLGYHVVGVRRPSGVRDGQALPGRRTRWSWSGRTTI